MELRVVLLVVSGLGGVDLGSYVISLEVWVGIIIIIYIDALDSCSLVLILVLVLEIGVLYVVTVTDVDVHLVHLIVLSGIDDRSTMDHLIIIVITTLLDELTRFVYVDIHRLTLLHEGSLWVLLVHLDLLWTGRVILLRLLGLLELV